MIECAKKKPQPAVRVRFAPSPTGFLHIGGTRTALFNYLFAKNQKGKFILRIEDTDLTRSSEEAHQQILDGLAWLGLLWDEGPGKDGPCGPYLQSERLAIYQKYVEKLLKEDKAYSCYCTPEELEKKREEMRKRGENPHYDGKCKNLSSEERKPLEKEGRKAVIRFRWDDEVSSIDDLIHGTVSFEQHTYDDFVIQKADGSPTYNFACVVDDHLMEITHVIRGDDHLTNTPRQIALYNALGFPPPKFAHIPLILGADKSRLSKRHGATNLLEYREMGYLSESLFNFLALLGWSPGTNQEILSQKELIEKFSLKRITKRNAVFNLTKLEWMNGQYIKKLTIAELVKLVRPYLEEKGLLKGKEVEGEWLEKIVVLYQPRIRTLAQIAEDADFFFLAEVHYQKEAVEEFLRKDYVPDLLARVGERLEKVGSFTVEEIENQMRNLADSLDMSGKDFIPPLRVALTGKTASPPLFDVIYLLGKEKTLERIRESKKLLVGG